MTFLYKADAERADHWRAAFAARRPDMPFRIWPDIGDASRIRYMAAWLPPDDIATAYPNLEILFSTGAGVDQLKLSELPQHLKVVRMLDPNVPRMMAEFVMAAVLALHANLLLYMDRHREARWDPLPTTFAARRKVGVMGLGRLGSFVCGRLAQIGFQTSGWSRSPCSIEGVVTHHGADQFARFLSEVEILVCLLPLTVETKGILSAPLFDRLPRGAMLVNVGRGGHLDQADLLAALDSGQLSGAVLDVTEPEPLPAGNPLWRHPRILVTPHIASTAKAETSVEVVLNNLDLIDAGQPPLGLIDRSRGY